MGDCETLYEMVQKSASMHSTRVAVTFDSCNEVGIVSRTYGQLLSLANELTSLLEKHGLQNQNIFGLYCHPGVNLPNWILGILQLPAAYAPLDPDSPPLLSVTVMDQCGLTYALVQSNILQRFQSTFFPHLHVEVCGVWHNQGLTLVKIQRKGLVPWSLDQGMQEQCGDGQVEEQQQQLAVMAERDAGRQGALAYILHTSGTTGSPKTVRVPHQCIMPNIQHLRDLFQVTPDDVVFMASPLTFDPSVVEMFLSLSSGACLLIVPSVIKKVSSRLARVLFQKHRTTVIQATPTLLGRFGGRVLRGLVLSGSSTLRVLALGGEPCPPLSVLRSWRAEGNSTRIFNLYGITEVSCWATCYELHLENMNLDSVPLGSALRDTVVEVRGEDGAVVTQGDGQIFIGGQERVCFLGTEMTVAKGTMRGTGDWVQVRDSHLYYLGRRDRLVKRHGQKLHLDALHQVLESLPQVEMCAVTLWEGKRVVAFVVPTSSSEDPVPSSGALKREILAGLSGLLPSHCVPDSILLLPELPLTSHGKVNMRKLLQVYERQRAPLISQDALGKRDTLRKHLQILWREALSFCDDVLVSEDSRFLLSGGDSIRSLRLCEDITAAVGVSMPGLLEVILNGSFSDLLCHVAMATFEMAPLALPPDHSSPPPAKKKLQDSSSPPPAKKKLQDSSSPVTAKKKLQDSSSPVCLKRRLMEFVVVRRAGEVVEMPHPISSQGCKQLPSERTDHTLSHTAGSNEKTDHTLSHTAGSKERTDHNLSHNAGSNEKTDHTLSHTAGFNERTDHTLSHTAGSNEKTDHTLSHTAGPNEKTDHTLSHTAGSNERTDHTLSHTAWSNEKTDHTLSHTAGSNERTDHTLSHTAGSNEKTDHTLSHTAGSNEKTDHTLSHTAGPNERTDHTTAGPLEGVVGGAEVGGQRSGLRLRVRWRSDTGRCVDASAVLLVHHLGGAEPGGAVAFVGSHSHRLQAIHLQSGEMVWERVLGGRIEASAAVTCCGSLIVIGCYDGQVYFLAVDTGKTHWAIGTGDAVKCSPVVDTQTGLVLVGSHDGHMYALDPEGQRCVWSRHCGGGAIFSSPCLHPSLRQLYVATLRGQLHCLCPDTGALVWTYSSTAPFFSSPCCCDTVLCIGSVDGSIYGFSHTGHMMWQFPTSGPVFSSPCSLPASLANQTVFCGSHDGGVYCVRSCSGSLVWRFGAGAKVFSSPFLFEDLEWGSGGLVAVASTDGTLYILGAEDGELRASLSLPGEIFSSPVLWRRTLVVGCRNDYVYGIELTTS